MDNFISSFGQGNRAVFYFMLLAFIFKGFIVMKLISNKYSLVKNERYAIMFLWPTCFLTSYFMIYPYENYFDILKSKIIYLWLVIYLFGFTLSSILTVYFIITKGKKL